MQSENRLFGDAASIREIEDTWAQALAARIG